MRSTPWWETDPEGPAFEAARRALKAGFGKEAALMGAGGSIGFVQPFSEFLKGAPCLLTGVEDPECGAHSENESLHLGDWKKCMRAAVHLTTSSQPRALVTAAILAAASVVFVASTGTKSLIAM